MFLSMRNKGHSWDKQPASVQVAGFSTKVSQRQQTHPGSGANSTLCFFHVACRAQPPCSASINMCDADVVFTWQYAVLTVGVHEPFTATQRVLIVQSDFLNLTFHWTREVSRGCRVKLL